MKLSELNIYPVKSLKSVPLTASAVDARGLRNDRRWMLTDPDGHFFTQREVPRMALISVEVTNGYLTVGAPETESLQILIGSRNDTVSKQTVKIWNSECAAAVYPTTVNQWFSDFLGLKCQLVEMPETTHRPVDPTFAVRAGDDVVSFADGYPFLLIGEGSLGELNRRLDVPVPMNRFRPNFVVSGSEPFAEDGWRKIRIGETVMHIVKPCARCVLTTVDQVTGIKDGKEPLKTLSAFRNFDGKALFGQNLIAENPGGTVRVGDEIVVLETK